MTTLGNGWKTGMIRDSSDTINIRWATYFPQPGTPRQWLVFLNGRSEWIEKYAYVAPDMHLPEDCGFLTMDHRGQGGSGGARSFVEDYSHFASDLRDIVNLIVGDAPYAIFGHSMGGLIALYAQMMGYIDAQRIALLSPLLGIPNSPIPTTLARPISKWISAVGLGPLSARRASPKEDTFAGNFLTGSYARFIDFCRSPYPCPPPTFQWVEATFRAFDEIFSHKNLSELTAPVLIVAAGREKVVDNNAIFNWVAEAEACKVKEIRFEIIREGLHELLSETPPIYRRTIDRLQHWFGFRVTGTRESVTTQASV
jgi:lysophospholipase